MKKPLTPEGQIALEVTKFMRARKWRRIRHQVGGGGTWKIGENGMCDLQFLYYLPKASNGAFGACLNVWIETKAPGWRPPGPEADCKRCKPEERNICRPHQQRRWQNAERERGAVVIVVSGMEDFARWYHEHFPDLPGPEQGGLFE